MNFSNTKSSQKATSRIRSADEETRRLAFVRERALRDEVSFLNDAKREGEQLGIEKGRLAEARDVVRAQLNFKFGEVPGWVEERLTQADHDQLKGWMRDVLFADSLEAIFKH
ncbi:hypothetical protein [Vreelandella neptunia]|uniref:DUF4351 domain-containing protein n=1 Tax=Vreelandella neptunia TaxID=115551 RepID=A0ABZ0YPM0_9GAMM|nr:hypothetical protein [Halomonas neptunia]MDN3559134.1 hypothetical protein [Halomonas neptunia]WQH14095.1 hypothetical protein SR894_06030 [Halomonas neptunia]